MKTSLIINAHLRYPNVTNGSLNDALEQKAKEHFEKKGFSVIQTKIADGYTLEEEAKKYLDAEIIILQTPINWFGAPWIYKKYIDELFNYALANKSFFIGNGDGRTREDPTKQYGTNGKLSGTKFMVCATWNAPAEAFDNPSYQIFAGKSVADIFLPITSVFRFAGCDIVDSYNCFNVFKRSRMDIEKDIDNYPIYLSKVFNL